MIVNFLTMTVLKVAEVGTDRNVNDRDAGYLVTFLSLRVGVRTFTGKASPKHLWLVRSPGAYEINSTIGKRHCDRWAWSTSQAVAIPQLSVMCNNL
jgi:hypothetical protein